MCSLKAWDGCPKLGVKTMLITANLSVVGKIVIMILMYIGRVGILTLIMYFTKHSYTYAENEIGYPVENVLLG